MRSIQVSVENRSRRDRILLLLDNKVAGATLWAMLADDYDILDAVDDAQDPLAQPFDLAILDEPNLTRVGSAITQRKAAAEPCILPVALVSSREDKADLPAVLLTDVDELFLLPISVIELRLRVRNLLAARHRSQAQAQRGDDLQAFIHALTHDLRAPLMTITGFSGILAASKWDQLDDESRRYIGSIALAGQQMNNLIAAVVDFTKLGRENIVMGPVPLGPLVYNSCQILQEQIQAKDAQIKVQADLPSVQGNQALLQIVLLNLLSNAVKYVAVGTQPQVDVDVVPVRNGVRIEVRDNGVGISPDSSGKLFTPFTRLKNKEQYPGLGLGLASVRKAVDIMGGEVGVFSEPGEGSTFWFQLPLADV